VLLFDAKSWRSHRWWAVACGLLGAGAVAWYAVACVRAGHPLGGSSLPGLICGTGAGLLIVYEFLFVLRKFKSRWAFWTWSRADTRLRRHIWLGLLSVPLALVHGGVFTRGGTLVLVLLAVFLAVIVSGVWGLALQQLVPRRLLEDVPAETIVAEVPRLAAQLEQEAELLVLATCGPPTTRSSATSALRENVARVHAARAGRGAGLLNGPVLPPEPIPDTEPLRDYFTRILGPYLRRGATHGSRLTARQQAAEDFRELRARVNPAAHPVVDALEEVCERRRQFDRQTRFHFWLHSWLWLHLPLSASLLLLLAWHAVTAILYW
jgi:hypothetical protein